MFHSMHDAVSDILDKCGKYFSNSESSPKNAGSSIQRFSTMPHTSQSSLSSSEFVRRAKSLSTLSNMASNDVIVTVSGAAISMLFYENFRSNDNQIGFLLGNVHLYVTKNVTDMDREVEEKKKHIHINSVMTCPSVDKFHNSAGLIDVSKISTYINDKENKIIGWFRLRKHRDLNLTFMDKILHKQFAEYFSSKFHFESDEFVMCLLNNTMNSSNATHKYQYIFYRYRNKTMEPLQLKIHNLADDATSYKPGPVKSRNKSTDYLSEYIESHSSEFSRKTGLEAVGTIHKVAEVKLRQLCPELSKCEAEVASLEEDLIKLKRRIESLEKNHWVDLNVSGFDPVEQSSTHNHTSFDSFQKLVNAKSEVGKDYYYSSDPSFEERSITSHKTMPLTRQAKQKFYR